MAKEAKTVMKKSANQATETKNWSRVIRAVKNNKTGTYSFSESMVNKDRVKDFLDKNKQ